MEQFPKLRLADSPHVLRSVPGDGLEYNLKTCIPDRLATPEMGDSLEHLGAWDCYTRLLPCLH